MPGDRCRDVESSEEAEIVEVEAAADPEAEPAVVWIPAGSEEAPDRRRTAGFDEVV